MNYYKFSFPPLILLEIIVSVVFLITFGFGNFFLFLMLSMLGGIILLAIFWKNVLAFEITTLKEMFMHFAFVIAGFLLIIPGVLSSILGVLTLIFALIISIKRPKYAPKRQNDEEIIDVEIIEERK